MLFNCSAIFPWSPLSFFNQNSCTPFLPYLRGILFIHITRMSTVSVPKYSFLSVCHKPNHLYLSVQVSTVCHSSTLINSTFWCKGDSWFFRTFWKLEFVLATSSALAKMTFSGHSKVNCFNMLEEMSQDRASDIWSWTMITNGETTKTDTSCCRKCVFASAKTLIIILFSEASGQDCEEFVFL